MVKQLENALSIKKAKQLVKAGVALGAVTVSAAHAALPAGVETAIETAQTDLVALLAALTAAGVVIWVARVIYNKFRVK